MNELTIISGKGGTGKTSIVASFAVLAQKAVVADADVDAADLHLVLTPEVLREEEFWGGNEAVIDPDKCTQCGDCLERCRFEAISPDFTVHPFACEGCGVCVYFCPAKAIDFPQKMCGKYFISQSRTGPMVHARLGVAEENSGKLVAVVREHARKQAKAHGCDLVLVDGPPGVGCPVIAAVTGATAALIVSEPTMSGRHDAQRAMELSRFFKIPALLCINKYDLNPRASLELENFARENGVPCVGRVPYDQDVTRAMVAQKAVVEFSQGPAAKAIAQVWEQTVEALEKAQAGRESKA